MFLKKCEVPTVSLDDFYIGSQVTIFSRVLKVTDYGDVHTRSKFEKTRGRTFAMIKPDGYRSIGKILNEVFANGFYINKLKMSRFNQSSVSVFYKEHIGKPYFPALV